MKRKKKKVIVLINPDFNPLACAIVPTGVLSNTVPAIFGGNVELGCALAQVIKSIFKITKAETFLSMSLFLLKINILLQIKR